MEINYKYCVYYDVLNYDQLIKIVLTMFFQSVYSSILVDILRRIINLFKSIKIWSNQIINNYLLVV